MRLFQSSVEDKEVIWQTVVAGAVQEALVCVKHEPETEAPQQKFLVRP